MAIATWPSGLPTTFQLPGPVRMPKKLGNLVFASDVGPGMVRARSAIVEEVYDVTFRLTASQYSTFETFVYTTLVRGSQPFTMANPITGTTDRFRFDPEANPPWSPVYKTPYWLVTCRLLRRR